MRQQLEGHVSSSTTEKQHRERLISDANCQSLTKSGLNHSLPKGVYFKACFFLSEGGFYILNFICFALQRKNKG